ncbi:MAG: RelA/SpoT domain-containing protein [Candidatus Diapherotrites archaeon]|nr:RelA/SpoT domain-containing protein [Candidatus Diapherotrites archaeon]
MGKKPQIFTKKSVERDIIFRDNYPTKFPVETKKFLTKENIKQIRDRAKSTFCATRFIVTHPIKTIKFRRLAGSYASRRIRLIMAKSFLASILETENIKPLSMISRVKRAYSLYAKAERKNVPIENIVDEALGIRVIVKNTQECYDVLNALKKHFPNAKYKIKDYITKPRAGVYRGIHVITDALGQDIEIQIRSVRMIAETNMMDQLLGDYRKGNKEKRAKLAEMTKDLYTKFEKYPNQKVKYFIDWFISTGVSAEFATFAARIMREAGLLSKKEKETVTNAVKRIAKDLIQREENIKNKIT